MKALLRKLLWPAVVVIIVAGIYLYQALRPLAVDGRTVRAGRIEEYVTEEAKTQLHTDRVVAAAHAGTMRRIELEVGDRITAGQTITSIEDSELKLTLGQMQDQLKEIEARLAGADVTLPKPSEVESARQSVGQAEKELSEMTEAQKATDAYLAYAEVEFHRTTELHAAGTATQDQLDQARRDYDVARPAAEAMARRAEAAGAAVDVARLRVHTLQASLGDTAYLHKVFEAQAARVRKMIDLYEQQAQVVNPIDGVLLDKYVDSERYVQPGTELVRIGDMKSIEVRADILSDEVGRVKAGQKALLVGPAIREPGAEGTVRQVYPSGFTKVSSLGVRQQRVQVLIDFDNSKLDLGPGYKLDVKIVVATDDNAVIVPSEAVFATAQAAGVFVVEGGRAHLRTVTTGLKGDNEYQVTQGLKAGDVVVLRPPTDLKDGQRVKVSLKNENTQPGAA
jgi:HlyD family secretion protein